jgi:phage shock protein PspC (stress-responsive transcriptional regulator)
MAIPAVLIVATFALYCGFFYLLALALRMGAPLDALKAGAWRSGLGLAGTLLSLVVHIFLRLANASLETMIAASDGAIWAGRIAIWTFVLTQVYRVTRWRKGKLAAGVAAGLALNYGIDFLLGKLGETWTPFFASWAFRLC